MPNCEPFLQPQFNCVAQQDAAAFGCAMLFRVLQRCFRTCISIPASHLCSMFNVINNAMFIKLSQYIEAHKC